MTAAFQLPHKIHVLGKKEDLDSVRMPGKVAIVLDVLFATSTIITVLANEAREVVPRVDEAAARDESTRHPEDSYVLAGELLAETLPGFAPATPLALLEHGIAGKTVIYSTTNGTVAFGNAGGADHIYGAALLNGRAVIEHVLAAHPDKTILIVCAGSMGNFNLEDFYGAGYLVDLLLERLGDATDVSDAARVARTFYRAGDPLPTLMDCRVGRMMTERGLAHEVAYAAQCSTLEIVPRLTTSGVLRA